MGFGFSLQFLIIVLKYTNFYVRSNFLFFSMPRYRLQFVPDDLKDDKYWARRRKNNMAAKRSRDARRMKENQIALRAGFLEKEVNLPTPLKLKNTHLNQALSLCVVLMELHQCSGNHVLCKIESFLLWNTYGNSIIPFQTCRNMYHRMKVI